MKLLQAKVIDSTHLELLKPLSARDGQTLVLFVAESEEMDDERLKWLALSLRGLQSAYAETEPVYETTMVREKNPEYAP